jgi:hypothetical protein
MKGMKKKTSRIPYWCSMMGLLPDDSEHLRLITALHTDQIQTLHHVGNVQFNLAGVYLACFVNRAAFDVQVKYCDMGRPQLMDSAMDNQPSIYRVGITV